MVAKKNASPGKLIIDNLVEEENGATKKSRRGEEAL